MKILLFGSAYMTSLAERAMFPHHTIVGHVPCLKPRFPGVMQSRELSPASLPEYDLALSVLYDRKITHLTGREYNIHPGLLPEYGGVNTSWWALHHNAPEFGWTCHRVNEEWDGGPILSRVTFPITPTDTPFTLFTRQASILPCFVRTCIALASELWQSPLPEQKWYEGAYYSARQFDNTVTDEERRRFRYEGERIASYVRSKS